MPNGTTNRTASTERPRRGGALWTVIGWTTRGLTDVTGGALVEFGLVLPFVLTLLAGIFEFGTAVYTGHSVVHSARVGTQFAIAKGFDAAGIQTAVEAASDADSATLTVSSRQYCECGDGYGTAVACTTTCAAGVPLARFVEVTVTHAYSPVFPFLSSMTPATIDGAATVRVP